MLPDIPAQEAAPTQPTAALEVVYHDRFLLVFNKPPGLLAVPGKGPDKQDCLSARVQAQYPDALIVHRLDMATSGLMLMARGAEMQRRLSAAFAQRQVHKRYVAVVAGMLTPSTEWHTIDLPIAVDWPRRPLRIIDTIHGQSSQTRWRCVAANAAEQTSRLELEPITGRSHQLRVHLQALGHPILGDALYAPPAVQAASPRLLLHAHSLELTHPATGETMHWHCTSSF